VSTGLLPGAALEVTAADAQRVDISLEGRPRRISPALAEAVYVEVEEPGAA
jgi:hypothetical protein